MQLIWLWALIAIGVLQFLAILWQLTQSRQSLKVDLLNGQLAAQQQLQSSLQSGVQHISESLEKRLNEGLEKTTTTFTDVVKRLAIIDEAQKKITELSGSVIGLQDLLNDKRSRGAFGEVQLANLIQNLLPASNYEFQHTLSNGKRVDCLLTLPPPSGNIAIDAKFPLETYRRLVETAQNSIERKSLEQQFRQDIRKHLQDIASKYIISGETADGALMFIPAESIFAEIHSHYPDLIDLSHQLKVWIASPTTMMAILTTASAVLKDDATRKQVHIIQEHLTHLAKDFARFDKRLENLSRHILLAHEDATEVKISAKKITQRFEKIEKVELELEDELA